MCVFVCVCVRVCACIAPLLRSNRMKASCTCVRVAPEMALHGVVKYAASPDRYRSSKNASAKHDNEIYTVSLVPEVARTT